MIWDIRERTFEFAVVIIRFSEQLPQTKSGDVVAKQLIRSGTSIGANTEEAGAAESKVDFAHRMAIALREAREVRYWLRIVKASKMAEASSVDALLSEAEDIAKIIGPIVSAARGKRKKAG